MCYDSFMEGETPNKTNLEDLETITKIVLEKIKTDPSSVTPDLRESFEKMIQERDRVRSVNHANLEENRLHAGRTIDHWILTASLGSFGLFLIFLKDLAFTPFLAVLMIASWLAFIVASFIVLETYSKTVEASALAQEKGNKSFFYDPINDEDYKRLSSEVNKLNKKAMFYFKAGVGIALIFAIAAVIVALKTKYPELNGGYYRTQQMHFYR